MPYPAVLGVWCDGADDCEDFLEGDFLVGDDDDHATRFGYALDYATEHGWAVLGRRHPLTALTYCPGHKPANR